MDGSIIFARWRQCDPVYPIGICVVPVLPLVSRFEHINRQTCPGSATFPLKIAPSCFGIPQSNTWFLGPTRVHTPNGIYIGSAVLARLTIVTDRPTDRPRCSVSNNRPHLST